MLLLSDHVRDQRRRERVNLSESTFNAGKTTFISAPDGIFYDPFCLGASEVESLPNCNTRETMTNK